MNSPRIRVILPVLLVLLLGAGRENARAQSPSTAWHDGRFHVDTAGVVGRSDIVLGQPNLKPAQAMPLGNGTLGAAVWSADGLTVQLNRADTLPDRDSPGQVVIPGLSAVTQAKDYSGRLDLYNGEFKESGNGMKATVFVQPHTDTLIVDVTGADPKTPQTVQLKLWAPRTPKASIEGQTGLLAQSWIDNKNPGSSGRPFGSLAAVTALGQNVSAAVTDPLTITVSVKPYADGHFRVIVASPHYDGRESAASLIHPALADTSAIAHREWWHGFWDHAALIRISSADGSGEYMENLRHIYLFAAVAEKGSEYPGTQAGVADMLSSARDVHHWDSSAFWHWNLRMQVAANLGAGLTDVNAPYFNLYRESLPGIEDWTRQNMHNLPGICVPETMRFNGPGIEYESSWTPATMGRDCDAGYRPYYNARTISTGAEVSFWIWQQYLATGDRKFLAENYPVMAASARFLLAYQKPGTDGLLHTSPSNAHETQWDVIDPTTDLAGIKTLYPETIEAAKLLGKDPDLIRQLQAALSKIPAFPRTQESGPLTLLPPTADASGQDVIAASYQPAAEKHNIENIGLEPVWPYGLIGDASPDFALARRTYEHRPFVAQADWSCDPMQAARLDLGSEVQATLVSLTEHYQEFANGLANWGGHFGEFYVEESGVVADALQEALVQDYDGLIRIAPAIPSGWDFDGSVYVRGKTKVDVQVTKGVVTTAVIEAGTTEQLKVRNPWPGRKVDVISSTGAKAITADSGPVLTFHAVAGTRYLLAPQDAPSSAQPFAPVTGTPATAAKRLGPVQIGLFPGSGE
ncbi:glycosyl hydrolase family 95 catalytic domain-containing protein [Paracidobacterium acidisoli]|uniref:Glycoside hydrolase n=1 Tax=Paracidobacterium acidisoli TaxID=2303751 RepID=A0A372ILP7_9BACT|nr:glycoside hydrolase [Paracidobacterium acidisoli]MBT9332432.1 glycoside hydrolase [Paracidobacterium acidisoli]